MLAATDTTTTINTTTTIQCSCCVHVQVPTVVVMILRDACANKHGSHRPSRDRGRTPTTTSSAGKC